MKSVLLHSPDCHQILLVLSQSDRCRSITLSHNRDKFINNMYKLIKQEVKRLQDHQDILMAKETSDSSDESISSRQLLSIKHKIGLCNRLLQNEDNIFVVSCVNHNDDGLKKLKSALIESGTRCAAGFYPEVSLKFCRMMKDQAKLDHSAARVTDMASSYDGMKESFYQFIDRKNHDGQATSELNDLEDTLKVLHDSGLIFWFDKSPRLRDLVFSHPAVLVDFLRAVFQKNINQSIDFNQLDEYEKGLFNNSRRQYKNTVRKLHNTGVMTASMLKVLLGSVEIHEDDNGVGLSLLEKLGIGVRISESEVFFPWYVDKTQCEIMWKVRELATFTTRRTYLHLNLNGNFSHEVFSLLCVQIINLFKHELNWDSADSSPVVIWKDGLYLDKSNPLFLQYNSDREVKVLVSGQVDSIEGHMAMWKQVKEIMGKVNQLRVQWFEGLYVSCEADCPHCLVETANNNQAKSESVAQKIGRYLI